MRTLIITLFSLFICISSAFAFHVPNRDELNKIQVIFAGSYFMPNSSTLTERLTFDDNGDIEFKYNKAIHIINKADLQVDFNKGITIQFKGTCSGLLCHNKNEYFNVMVSPQGYYSSAMKGYGYTFVVDTATDLRDTSKMKSFTRIKIE